MDLNYVLVWLVGASTLVHLVSLRGRLGGRWSGWYGVSAILFVTLAVGLALVPLWAGYIGFGLWTLLVVLPLMGARLVSWLAGRGLFAWALPFAKLVSWLHPADGWRELQVRIGIHALMRRGEFDRARRAVAELESRSGPQGVWAKALGFRLDRDWLGMRRWVEGHGSPGALLADTSARTGYLRALGELSEVEGLLATYLAARSVANQPMADRAADQLVTAAFCGRPDLVERLYEAPLAHRDKAERALWGGTALQSRGESAQARAVLEAAAAASPPDIGRAVMERLEAPLPVVSVTTGAPRRALDILERDVEAWSARVELMRRRPVATLALLGSLVAVFVAELPGGSTNPENLYDLGMLVLPLQVSDGGWWRFVTAGFLHFGPMHFALNSIALFLFGRVLERVYGAARLLTLYLVSNIAAMLAVAAFSTATVTEPQMLVGASGGVMGLVGAMTALVARAWLRFGTRALSTQLTALLVVLGLQITFDTVTPMVSQTAHLGGLGVGLLLGLALLPDGRLDGGPGRRRA